MRIIIRLLASKPRWSILALVVFPISVSAASELDDRISALSARIEALERELATVRRSAGKEPAKELPRVAKPPKTIKANGFAEPRAAEPKEKSPEEPASVEQVSFVARDGLPAIGRGRMEVSQTFDYGRGVGTLQSDRFVRSTTTMRYGFTERGEILVAVPLYYSARTTSVFGGSITRRNSGLGDVYIQGSYQLAEESADYPGFVALIGLSMPTGNSPYSMAASQAGVNPIDPLSLYQSGGHWAPRIGGQVFKTIDPLVLFAGGGIEYAFARRFSGIEIAPGIRYVFNFGLGFAVSELSTLGMSFSGAYSENFRVQNARIRQSSVENQSMRFSLIQRIGDQFWLEPAVTVGLTDESPDVGISVSLRKRF
jgi:hypothetical protein